MVREGTVPINRVTHLVSTVGEFDGRSAVRTSRFTERRRKSATAGSGNRPSPTVRERLCHGLLGQLAAAGIESRLTASSCGENKINVLCSDSPTHSATRGR